MNGLAISDVAERTGIAAGTIRMWEQRYGFPEPERTTAGYRLYSEDDVEALRRVPRCARAGSRSPPPSSARAARRRPTGPRSSAPSPRPASRPAPRSCASGR